MIFLVKVLGVAFVDIRCVSVAGIAVDSLSVSLGTSSAITTLGLGFAADLMVKADNMISSSFLLKHLTNFLVVVASNPVSLVEVFSAQTGLLFH